MVDYTAENGWLCTTLRVQQLMQSVIQARWFDESEFMTLPFVNNANIHLFYLNFDVPEQYLQLNLPLLQEITRNDYEILARPLRSVLEEFEIEQMYNVLQSLPEISVNVMIQGPYIDNMEAIRSIDIFSNYRNSGEDNEWVEIHPNEVRILWYFMYICNRLFLILLFHIVLLRVPYFRNQLIYSLFLINY